MSQTVVGAALGDTRPERWEAQARRFLLPILQEVLVGTDHDLVLDGMDRSLYLRWADGPRMEAVLNSVQVLMGPMHTQAPDPLLVEMEFPQVRVTLQRDLSNTAQALAMLVLNQRRGCPHCGNERRDYQGAGFRELVLSARPDKVQSYDLSGKQDRIRRHAEILGGMCELGHNLGGSEDVLSAQLCLMGHTGGLVALERTLKNKDVVLGVRLPDWPRRHEKDTDDETLRVIVPPTASEQPPTSRLVTT